MWAKKITKSRNGAKNRIKEMNFCSVQVHFILGTCSRKPAFPMIIKRVPRFALGTTASPFECCHDKKMPSLPK